jgi:hypothetical protein
MAAWYNQVPSKDTRISIDTTLLIIVYYFLIKIIYYHITQINDYKIYRFLFQI